MTSTDPRLDALVAAYANGGIERLRPELEAAPIDGRLLESLVTGVASASSAVPASWCLRAVLEEGVELDRGATAALCRALQRVTHDDARLHLCQSVQHLDIPSRNADQLARFLRAGADGEHKFVRAWAVDGFQHLARQHDRYRREAGEWLERARRDPAASVRARARRIDATRGR